jgi:hypothetical protein
VAQVAFYVGGAGCWFILVHFCVFWRTLAQSRFNQARQKKWGKMYLAEI